MTNPTTPNFRDSKGRVWELAINVGLAREIRDGVGVDFGRLAGGMLFVSLFSDPYKFASALWLLCEKQAKAANVTPTEFAESLDRDALDAAQEAIVEAVINFTPAAARGGLINARENIRQTSGILSLS